MQYLPDTLVTDVEAHNERLALKLSCQDFVDFHSDIYVKKIVVHNLANREREVRLFFHHDFHISGNDVGDTALYEPKSRSLIHYKDHRYFLMNGLVEGRRGIDQFATGIKEYRGSEGTWRDAEDGVLGGNPIAQGSVDSTLALHALVKAGGEVTLYDWLVPNLSKDEVLKTNDYVLARGPEYLLKRTWDYWTLWVEKERLDFGQLPPEIVRLYKRSLLILRTQIDNGGSHRRRQRLGYRPVWEGYL